MLKKISYIAIATILLLLIPFIAMQFNSGVDWGLFDFIVAGALLFGSGLIFVLITNKLNSKKNKVVVGIIILLILLIVWAELAVGIFGSPWAGS